MMLNKKLFLASIISCSLVFPSGICAAETVQLTLAESIGMALARDERITSADAEREAALHGLKAARRSKGPVISWNAQAAKIGGRNYRSANDAHDTYGDPHAGDYNSVYAYPSGRAFIGGPVTVGSYAYHNTFANSWSLTVPVYTGGQLEGQMAAGRYRLNRADMDMENIRQVVRYQAAEAYADLLYRENLAQVAQEAVDKANTQLELIRAQFEEGAVAEADLLMMMVNIANYKQSLVNAKSAVAVAKSTLASVVGLPQDTDIELCNVFSYEAYDKDLPACEDYALAHRPDGLAADYDIKAAAAQMETAKSGYRPKVSASATQSIASNYPFRSERSNAWEAGLTIAWNIFDNGVTRENVRQAEENTRSYEARARQVKKTIQLETRTAYLEMKAAEQNITGNAMAVKQAQDSYVIAQVRYEEGVDVLLGVTDAQEKLIQARSNYLTALYQYNLSRARLEKAMGVPVAYDAQRYKAVEEDGASSHQALREAGVSQTIAEAES